TPQFQAQLLRDGSLDNANSANITANWYLVDTPTQRSAPETWQALTNNSLQGHAGRHVLLALSYSENGQVMAETVEVSAAIVQDIIPTNVAGWHSGLSVSFSSPASIASYGTLFSQNLQEVEGESSGAYTTVYEYRSELAPATTYTTVSDMIAAHPGTKVLSVMATQTQGMLTQQLGPVSVAFSNGSTTSPGELAMTQPLLAYDQPDLVDSDTVGLINLSAIEIEITTLLQANANLSANYQWQASDDNGSTWNSRGNANPSFNELTSLTSGERYRLQIMVSDSNSTVAAYSDETVNVQSSAAIV
ncbi:hypothetical protein, partial [Aliivibrio finisterrensis]|uniref:hypothetical protein n=1 Tax=Aliivibrio finisterrensis TaxID=511998 RepID=UPI00142ED130